MLPRRQRLTRRTFPVRPDMRGASASFSVVYGKGRGMSAVVAKAVARRSVDRHTLKRRMLSVMRPYFNEERYVVVYAKKSATLLTFKELQEELASLLSRSLR